MILNQVYTYVNLGINAYGFFSQIKEEFLFCGSFYTLIPKQSFKDRSQSVLLYWVLA